MYNGKVLFYFILYQYIHEVVELYFSNNTKLPSSTHLCCLLVTLLDVLPYACVGSLSPPKCAFECNLV